MKARLANLRRLSQVFGRIRPHLRGGRYLLALVMATSVGTALMDAVGIGLLVPLLSLLLNAEEARPMRPITMLKDWVPGHGSAFYVLIFCILIVSAIAFKNLLYYTSQILAAKLRMRLSVNLKDGLFKRLLGADMNLLERSPAGRLTNIFSVETPRTLGAFETLLYMGQRACIVVLYFGLLLVISWRLTILTVILSGLIGAAILFVYRRITHGGMEITLVNQRFANCLMECLGGMRVVRATQSQDREMKRFMELNRRQAELEMERAEALAMITPITELVSVAGAMTIVALAYVFLVKPGAMQPSYLPGFGFILLRLLPILNQLYGLQGNLVFFLGGLHEVDEWISVPQHPARAFGAVPFRGIGKSIRFENVSFRYPAGAQALDRISFEIPAGRTVALVGPSGSGKTTVASLLLRFRGPDAGQVLVDGQDYWSFTPESWHSSVAVVEQEAFLFHDTLARNIGYGFPEVRPEQIEAAVRMANLQDVVEGLSEGLNTIIGERGALLSGGQRQRLAIARALVRQPKLLILDEATSALDSVSEHAVQVALEKAREGRTSLVIAHRLSTIREADWIVVLEQGRISEQGRWEELVARDGLFARLLQLNNTRADARL